MPRIFDNIGLPLLPAIQETLEISKRADFCVGYFNLRGWRQLAPLIENWNGNDEVCRVLVGMQRPPYEEISEIYSLLDGRGEIDNQRAHKFREEMAEQFRQQLTIGAPTNSDEQTLRHLASQLRSGKVKVKLFLRHTLHAKLYMLFRDDPNNPMTGFLGSSNLTISGLSKQGELNVDVLEQDSCIKLATWFEDRWNDRYCLDISEELAQIIETSWARANLISPYHIYLKMAYHLSNEARSSLSEFRIPNDFGNDLFEFQTAAVKIAAHHINKRDGVLIGDVVGLGKTIMAAAIARIFEDDFGLETLIICPKNIVKMWEEYRDRYRMRARVLPISQVINQLPDLRRYRLVIIDESHNLRNRKSKRYQAIQEYINKNDSKCILLSATPYNKTYLDLSNQIRLFVSEDKNLNIRPEKLIKDIGMIEFNRRYQAQPKTIAAFEHSEFSEDWQELMRLYMIRRTRGFIQDNYALQDIDNGRKYLLFEDGSRSYFPDRIPKTIKFAITEDDQNNQYARLYSPNIVDLINQLELARYGLGNYIDDVEAQQTTNSNKAQLGDLSNAGKRLMGFCRTNLFKRLESSGSAFIQSVERHILRNHVFLYAIENDLELPIGTQEAELLDSRYTDEDADELTGSVIDMDEDEEPDELQSDNSDSGASLSSYSYDSLQSQAKIIYEEYKGQYQKRFKWIPSRLFLPTLRDHLKKDTESLINVLNLSGQWEPNNDTKLEALENLITSDYPNEKILVFSQFADTVEYITKELKARGIPKLEAVTGGSNDPTAMAWRFSPKSNDKKGKSQALPEIRVLVATDVLSEGQNLQDCSIVVNYDLPWAIIRLIQRAGRVDRIGQTAEEIQCFSFLPADGVDRIIKLRRRVRNRLQENAEVVGTDETFFEDDDNEQTVLDLYNEKSGILDDASEIGGVDLQSHAYQIWKNALEADPGLHRAISNLPDVVLSSKEHVEAPDRPGGALVFIRTPDGNDALAYLDRNGQSITENQREILEIAACEPDTVALPRADNHHQLVESGIRHIVNEEKNVGGQLGRPSGARYRTYTRLKEYSIQLKSSGNDSTDVERVTDDIYRFPLRQSAVDTLNRQLRSGIDNDALAVLAIGLRDEGRLCAMDPHEEEHEPKIICSMGLIEGLL